MAFDVVMPAKSLPRESAGRAIQGERRSNCSIGLPAFAGMIIGLTRYAGVDDFGRGSDFAGWVGDKHPRLPLAGQLNRETMRWRHVALFVSQRSCQ